MPRVKRATHAIKRRRNVLKQAKGYRHGRKSKEKLAIEHLKHAGRNAFRDRRLKKRDNRAIWTTKINAALRDSETPMSYSKFIGALKKKGIDLDRKVLSQLAAEEPKVFAKIVEEVR